MSCILAFPNRADEATLSGGSWTTGMPRTNLQTRTIKEAARTTDATTASTQFMVALPRTRKVRVLALVDHNMSLAATYRVRGYATGDLTTATYDSGTKKVFPAAYNEITADWDEGNFWDLSPPAEYLDGLTASLIHVLPSDVYARNWLVELTDTTNEAGYVQLGRLFISSGWVPAVNMNYGAAIQYEPRSEIDEAYSGAEYFYERPSPRVARFELRGLDLTEAMTYALDAQRVQSNSREVLFLYDLADTTHLLRRSFLGRMRTLSALEQTQPARFGTPFEIKELL